MVSPPRRPSWSAEIEPVLDALAAIGDARALPALFEIVADGPNETWLRVAAGFAAVQIARRTGADAWPALSRASEQPPAPGLLALETMVASRHPDTFARLQRSWATLVNAGSSWSLITIATELADPRAIPLLLSFCDLPVGDFVDEGRLVGALRASLEGGVDRCSTGDLGRLASLADTVGADWRDPPPPGSPIPFPPPLAPVRHVGGFARSTNWHVDFGPVREVATRELTRRGITPPTRPTEARRAS